MILSFHLADIGPRAALRLMTRGVSTDGAPGLTYAQVAITAPLTERLLSKPRLARAGLIAAWSDDAALERFLAEHPLARKFAAGWHVRLEPARIVGRWAPLGDLPRAEQPMADHEPAAVLTIGRLRLTQLGRFLRSSARAEGLATREPTLLAATGLACPPSLVATFSVWSDTAAMRAYAAGAHDQDHAAAVRAHAAQPFHHESAFIRFRPYALSGTCGRWPRALPDTRRPTASAV